MQSAWKVGALVVGFTGCVLGAYAVLGRSIFAESKDGYSAKFVDAGGVVSGAPVMLSGVNVGQVVKVQLAGASEAVVSFEIKKGIELPKGTIAEIPNSLIGIGDRPILLKPPVTASGQPLEVGSVLPGKMTSPLESMAPESGETIKALTATLKATQALLEDQKLKSDVQNLLVTSNKTAAEFGALAANLSSVVTQNQASLRSTLLKANQMMADLSQATAVIAKVASSGEMEGKINRIMDEMNSTMMASTALINDLKKTVNDPELQKPMKDILANTATMTETGTRIANNAEVMTKNGITLSEKAIEIAEKASKLADELSGVLQKFDKTLGSVAGIGQSSGLGKGMGYETTVTRETSPGRFRTDFEANLPMKGENLYLGIYDAFEGNKLIAQVGRPSNSRTEIRYGVYASKPGLGVKYSLAPGSIIRGDLFDVNKPRLDLRASFSLNKDMTGWIGVERIFNRAAPSIGIGIRR